jgi:glycosyltransferase involved in cell wall biosynthesis
VFRDRAIAAHGRIAPAIVTPNAANIDKFTFTQAQRDDTRARYGLEGSVVCGYLGAFVPWHAIDRFVHHLVPRLDEAPHLKLLLVGDGATFPALRQYIDERGLAERIILTGRVSHDEVPGLLAAMDMAVMPSAGDYTSPVKMFEFMACKVPPVAPDFEPIREIIVEGETGWMFPAGDMDAAVARVLEYSRDADTLRRVGSNAREYITHHRQWRHNILQLLAFHASIVERADAQPDMSTSTA